MRKGPERDVEKEMSIQEVKKLSPEKEKTQGQQEFAVCSLLAVYSCSEKKQGLVGTVLTTRERAFPQSGRQYHVPHGARGILSCLG